MALAAFAVFGGSREQAEGFSAEAYRAPLPEFSPSFFWMWNSRLDADKLCRQLDVMASNGVMNVCIHPVPKAFRPGIYMSEMEPDYLTPGYLDVYAKVVEHAKSLGMHSWLYDEGGWPSGGACGLVAASDSDGKFRARGIGLGIEGDKPFGVHAIDYTPGRGSYPSIIEKGATERFIDITYERYREKIGGDFGGTVRFAFTDEPDVRNWYWYPMLPWCADFAEEFKRRKGYDVVPFMPGVLASQYLSEGDDVERRLDCMEVIGDLLVERYLLPLRDWCRRNGLKFGGHFSGEDAPENGAKCGFGSLLKSMRAMDAPGVDMIWRQVWPETRAGAGRQPPFPRYAASASRQNGGRNVLGELFAIYGDSLSPLEMQWLANYNLVRGVNMLVFAYFPFSTAGQWMTLMEPHFGPVSPLWEFSGPFWRRLHRTCGMLARGRSAAEIAVFYDQRSFWRGGGAAETAANLHYAAASALDAMNCDYDFADDSILETATVEGGRLKAGAASYSTVVVPAWGSMKASVRSKLEEFRSAGGKVLLLHEIEAVPRTCRVYGCRSEEIRASKRVSGGSVMYFVVNESMSPSEDLEISFAETGTVVRVNHETGLYERVDAKDGRFPWKFDAAGAEIFIVGERPEAEAAPTVTSGLKVESEVIKEGWTLTPLRRHYAGKSDFVVENVKAEPMPVSLGDWREKLGYDFCGVALYRNEFESTGGEAVLDLGAVCHASSVRLNGEQLPDRFAGPFRWRVCLRKGKNTIEVKVANTLASAISDPRVRDRIARDFPPRSVFDVRQAEYDRSNLRSGLVGPVTIWYRKDD